MAAATCAACTTTYAVDAERCPQCGSTERATERLGGAVLPSVTVACGASECRYAGRERRVHLRTAAPGVLEVPRLACAGCGLDMPTVTPWPPLPDEEDTEVPKTTVHNGASNAYAEPDAVEETREDQADETGGEDVSAGNSSETSSEREPNSSEPSEQQSQSRARMTGNRSKKAATAKDSSAPSTDGGQAAGTSAADETR